MDIKVMIPSPPLDFNFDSASTSPYISSPSSPQCFGSSTRSSAFYRHITTTTTNTSLSVIPFNWEEKPGIPKKEKETNDINHDNDTDFEFDFSGQIERTSLSADELFHGGKIKPLKPPPRLQNHENIKTLDSPKSPISPKKLIKQAFSPRQKQKDFDPFTIALEQTRTENEQECSRGRTQRTDDSYTTRRRVTRSLSPFRVLFDREKNHSEMKEIHSGSSTWYRKWKLKNFLLFRSASEGRGTDKETLKKYSLLKKNQQGSDEDVKNSSFRSTESVGSGTESRRRGGPVVSAHELHYKVNRTVSEEMRKKTYLPYKQGLLGFTCLGFNNLGPGGYEISKGFGSMPHG